MENALGLVVAGGGARGAYQAGVLKRIGEIKRVQTYGNPVLIIGGASAGAIEDYALAKQPWGTGFSVTVVYASTQPLSPAIRYKTGPRYWVQSM